MYVCRICVARIRPDKKKLKVKAAKARPARIEAGVPHVRAALDAKEAAPI
jgi:hypothetical protein